MLSPTTLNGRITFNAQHAVFAPWLKVNRLTGVVLFNGPDTVFEDIAGELGKGRFDGRLAVSNQPSGVTARIRIGVAGAELGALLDRTEQPMSSGHLAFNAELEGVGRSPAAFNAAPAAIRSNGSQRVTRMIAPAQGSESRLKEKANAAVTLKLEDVPLETAVRLMAEVADLGAVRMNNVLFVTTPERAEKLRPNADGPTQPGNNVVPFPGGFNPPPGGLGGFGFGGVVPAIPVPPAPPPPPAEAPKVEEKKADPEPEKK